MEIRKALPRDAQDVWQAAMDRSRDQMQSRGASNRELGLDGFILYPLQAESETQPNYKQRISLSPHFWVAIENEEIIAFCMGYSFSDMQKFVREKNDDDILYYFTSGLDAWNNDQSAVYLSQWVTRYERRNRGIMQAVVKKFFEHAQESGAPAVVCEIAQSPLKNEASTALAKKMGMKMIATRTKTDPATGASRVTGVFMRDFRTG